MKQKQISLKPSVSGEDPMTGHKNMWKPYTGVVDLKVAPKDKSLSCPMTGEGAFADVIKLRTLR